MVFVTENLVMFITYIKTSLLIKLCRKIKDLGIRTCLLNSSIKKNKLEICISPLI